MPAKRLRQNRIQLLFVLVMIFSASGCEKTASIHPNNERQIVSSLAAKNRNVVHVALWTLEANDIDIPEGIDLKSRYDDNREPLQQLSGSLRLLDADKLAELDQSLQYHWRIYSPIWGSDSEHWE